MIDSRDSFDKQSQQHMNILMSARPQLENSIEYYSTEHAPLPKQQFQSQSNLANRKNSNLGVVQTSTAQRTLSSLFDQRSSSFQTQPATSKAGQQSVSSSRNSGFSLQEQIKAQLSVHKRQQSRQKQMKGQSRASSFTQARV